MLERLKEFYLFTSLSQTELSKKLDVTPQYIWKVMNKMDDDPSERLILSTLKAFPMLNEQWLRTGEGEMILSDERFKELAVMTARLLKDRRISQEHMDNISEIVDIMVKMDTNQLDLLLNVAKNFKKDDTQS